MTKIENGGIIYVVGVNYGRTYQSKFRRKQKIVSLNREKIASKIGRLCENRPCRVYRYT